ncbi:MAG: ATP-NAD kinase, partial [Proteobacteria bacterium]|nr:ATP-NAD kinase [Pseudomonadota bacterium]
YLEERHFAHTVLGGYEGVSNARDSVAATRAFIQQGVDLLIFVGGDGTARDVLSAATDAI